MQRRVFSLGFTLLELLIVVAIMALLAGVVAPRYFGQLSKSERGVAKAQVEAFGRALETFRLDVGRYPNQREGLKALAERPSGLVRWAGPYVTGSIPKDPWGNAYEYRAEQGRSAGQYVIRSLGADGRPGGKGADEDITLVMQK